MKNQQLVIQIKQILLPLLDSQSVELVDIELKGAIGNQVLRIYVDVEGGINLSQCVDLSSKISDILDMKDIMPGKYRLEVSSPGVYRPLKSKSDFQRNISRRITVNFLDGSSTEGFIKKVNDSDIYLENENEQSKFPISSIKSAKLKLQW